MLDPSHKDGDDAAVSVPDPDLVSRGQAIFDRLRHEDLEAEDAASGEAAEESSADASTPGSEVPDGADAVSPADNRAELDDSDTTSAEDAPTAQAEAPAAEPVTSEATAEVALAEPAVPEMPALEESVASPVEAQPEQVPAPLARHPAADRPLPRTIAIANQKGGVGKTTTTVNLGAALAELGFRVLVIDLDPQGNATTGLGINSRNLESSIYDVLLHDTPLDDCIEPTAVRNLFVAPATIDLAGAEIELVPAFSRELRLRRAIESLDGQFDFTIIDCPPSLGLITVNGLAAATEIIVPIQCEYYALEGLGQLLKNVTLVQGNLNPRLEISAIVLTMYDARTRLAEQVAQEVRAHFGDRVCRMVVPRTVRLSEAPSFGQPIITFDPSSRGAIAYRELAKEVSGGTP